MSFLDKHRPVFEELCRLETELHKSETRRNRERMEMLLHPDFVEFGRSGIAYSRNDVLEEFGPGTTLPLIRSERFRMVDLGERVVLLTYVSAHVDADGNPHRQTLRSSIWVRTKIGWQMRFHQGTPVADRRP